MSDNHVLDNVAWAALKGPQAGLAETSQNGAAVRFAPDVGLFCAANHLDAEGWEGLADLSQRFGPVLLFRAQILAPPAGWDELFTESAQQFVADKLQPAPDLQVDVLGEADIADMMALVELTEPGPFKERTIHTGEYLGLRRNGKLVAMAGQRMRCEGWGEISAVCVHPNARRQGLGAALTLHVAKRIRSSGREAFLHVREGNEAAEALYESIGFRVRRTTRTGVFSFEG